MSARGRTASQLLRRWAALPIPGPVMQLIRRTARQIQAQLLPPAPPLARLRKGPLMVTGFLSEPLGLGRGARLTIEALRQAGLQVRAHDIRPFLQGRDGGLADQEGLGPGGVWLLHCNPPEAEAMLLRTPRALWGERYLIGYWAWELPELPRSWARMARQYHEVWVPSRFVAEAVAPHARVVRVMPHPVAPEPDVLRTSETGHVHFAALADGRSTFARKNPAGAVEAFKRAFPQPSPLARLTIKLLRPEADPEGFQHLMDEAAGRPDIDVIVRDFTDAEMAAFLQQMDVVVSLHRAEGFGLVLAEALASGKAAVATAWSGNLDFMGGELSETLVPCTLVPTDDPTGRYSGAVWADPDLDAAASLIRRLAGSPELRRRLGRAGPAAIAALQAPWRAENLSRQMLGQLDAQPVAP